MLIQLTYSDKTFSLIVNSETVVELSLTEIDTAKLKQTAKNYIVLSNALFDSAALYNYILDKNQTKLSYSKALNTRYPNDLINRYAGKGFKVDHKSSNYSNSIKIPNTLSGQSWKSGFSSHMDINREISLRPYKYSLPEFNFSDATITKTNLEVENGFQFKKSSSAWVSSEANIFFESLDVLYNDKVKAFYLDGTFSSTLPATEQTVFKLINKQTKEHFKISVNSNNIYYKFKSGTNAEVTLLSESISGSAPYNRLIGIDIDKFTEKYPTTKNFFSVLSRLSVYVAGEEDLSANTTFTGVINSVKFLNSFNLEQRTNSSGQSLVTVNGTFKYDSGLVSLNTPLASYDLDLFYNSILSKYYFTVGTSGYWKDHIPLQSLASYTTNSSGVRAYSLDFIQFNIDYAAPLTKVEVSGDWVFDTIVSSPHLKSYITFESGTSTYEPDSKFVTQIGPNINRTLSPPTDVNDYSWQTTKYEVVDDFIIYLPANIDISTYYIMVSLEMSIPDTLNNDLEIKSLEFLSKTLSNNPAVENPISASQGELIPYTYTVANGYNYKARNPFVMNKQTQQYLQLSRQSGFRLVGDYAEGTSRGIRYKINSNGGLTYNLSTLQLFTYYEGLATRVGSTVTKSYFPETAQQIFQIKDKTRTYTFYIQSTNPGVDNTQGTIYVESDAPAIDTRFINFYLNGQATSSPIINANEWNVLGVVFIDKLDFGSYTDGYLDFTGPMSFDNISFYQLKNVRYTQSSPYRTWEQVQTTVSGATNTWNTWTSSIWREVLTPSASITTAALDMGSLYKTFFGNNIILSDSPEYVELPLIYESQKFYDTVIRQTSVYSVP
jgi:hypothetical protein